MKLMTILLSLVLTAQNANALVTKRALHSDRNLYQSYLSSYNRESFVSFYLSLQNNKETEIPSLENCLTDVLVGVKDSESCRKAVQELLQSPLNDSARETLASLLDKIVPFQQDSVFKDLLKGLLVTHPKLREDLQLDAGQKKGKTISELEYSAWLKLIKQKADYPDLVLLMNGKKVESLKSFRPSQGVYQWTLVSNVYKPYTFTGTWAQFAVTSFKNLEAFFDGNCAELLSMQQDSGDLHSEIFLNQECVSQSYNHLGVQRPEHLSDLPQKEFHSQGSKKWFWPTVLTVVGAGLALSLKNKHVKVTMPGAN